MMLTVSTDARPGTPGSPADTPAEPLLDRLVLWPLRAVWFVVPLVAGPLFGSALADSSDGFQTAVSVALWAIWAVALTAMLVPRTITLTLVRVVVPGALLAACWASFVGGSALEKVAAIAVLLVAVVVLMAPSTVTSFVDGSSYGPEQRLPLRTPPSLLLGPAPLAWLAAVVGAVAGPLLLAAGSWVLGAIVLVLGWGLAYLGVRALHGLSRRWLVLVPAGVVVHDLTAMPEPLLVQKHLLQAFRPAVGSDEEGAGEANIDLSLGASGLLLALEMNSPVQLARRTARAKPDEVSAQTLLVAPAQPGRALRAAAAKKLPVTR